MMKNSKNFLLLFLSNGKKPDAQYRIGQENELITTKHSNESAVYELDAYLKEQGQCLDKVFVFTSKATKEIINDEGKNTIDFFSERIKSIVAPENIISVEYNENNSMNEALSDIGEMGKIILRQVELLKEAGSAAFDDDIAEDITIHADMTGGMRNASMMMLGVMRLLNFSKLKMGKIYYSNWEKGRDENFVEDSHDVYRFFDLVAGATEFAKYGSVEKLVEYYGIDEAALGGYNEGCGRRNDISKQLYELIKAMSGFAKSIKLCRYGDFESACQELKAKVVDFDKLETKDYNANDKMFATMLPTIKESYRKLISDHNDLDIIAWCVERGYLQQAMTLYTERVPEFIGNNKFYTLSDKVKAFIKKEIKDDVITERFYVTSRFGSEQESEYNYDRRPSLEKFVQGISKELFTLFKDRGKPESYMHEQFAKIKKEVIEQHMFIELDEEDFFKVIADIKSVYSKRVSLNEVLQREDGLGGMRKRCQEIFNSELKELENEKESDGKRLRGFLTGRVEKVKSDQLPLLFKINKSAYGEHLRAYLLRCAMDKGDITCNLESIAAFESIVTNYTRIKMARNSSNHARHEKGYSANEIEKMILEGIKELKEADAYVRRNAITEN